MKKFIIALALLISCSGLLPAHAANWYWATEGTNGDQWYIDNSSVEKGNGRALFWTKEVLSNGGYTLRQIGMTKDRAAILFQFVIYNSEGEIIGYYVYKPWECEAIAIPPDSILDIIYHLVW